MSLLHFISTIKSGNQQPTQVISQSWEDRSRILEKGVNLFCWSRLGDERITSYLEQILADEPRYVRTHLFKADLEGYLDQARQGWGDHPTEGGDLFWKDISQLTSDFLSLTDSEAGTLHLKLLNDDACTKFHVDGYRMRLFTTYYGPGTEWLPEDAVNRYALGSSNHAIVKDTSKIQRMTTFDVGILKGGLANHKGTSKGVVHRSPAISMLGQKRIILRIDI